MNNKENKENTVSWLSFTTLTSKILLVFVFFCVFVVIFSGLFFIQSFQNYNQLHQYKDYALKLQESAYELRKLTSETALHQRAFIITKNPYYQEQRLFVWKKQVNPLLIKINEIEKSRSNKSLFSSEQGLLNKVFEETKKFENLQLTTAQNYNLLWEKGIQVSEREYGINLEKLEVQRKKVLNTIQNFVDVQNKKTNAIFDNVYINTLYSLYITLFFAFFLLVFVIIFGQIIYFQIRKAIKKCTLLIEKIVLGIFPPPVLLQDDEFDTIFIGLNNIVQYNAQVSIFAKRIGERDFDTVFTPASQEDILGNSLLYMQNQLQNIEDEEDKRNWVTRGFAKFAEIIRANNKDLPTLADIVLTELIAYLNANQGGFFVANSEDKTTTKLSMIACWAYDRKKFLEKEIIVHLDNAEGLLGEAFLEQQTIIRSDIPQDYIRITSGLGEETPTNLLIVPIKSTEKVEGILEIASFKKFQDYEISFIEKLCESFASAIVVIKNTEQTHFLLSELKQQAVTMQNQENELRKNFELVNEAQQEMHNKQIELENLKNSLEIEVKKRTQDLQGSLIRFDLLNQAASEGLWDVIVPKDGKLGMDTPYFWSPQLVKSLGYETEDFPDVLGSWMLKLHPEDAEFVYKQFVAHLKDKTGLTEFRNEHRLLTQSGEYRWFKAYAVTLRDIAGNAVRVAGYLNDVTHIKELDKVMTELKNQKEELEKNKETLELSNRKMQSNELVLKKAFDKMKITEASIKEKNIQLAESNQLLDDIENNSPSIIYKFFSDTKTLESKFLYVSKAIKGLLGYTTEEYTTLSSQQLVETIHPEDRKEYFKAFFNSVNNTVKFFWEGRMLHKEGHWIWVQSQSSPRKTEDGNIISIGSFIDIQQIKENELEIIQKNQQILASEEELRQNMEELQATQETMQQKQQEIERSNEKLTQREQVLKKALEKSNETQAKAKSLEIEYQELLGELLQNSCIFEENGKIISLSAQIIRLYTEQNPKFNNSYFYQKSWDNLTSSHNWESITEQNLSDIFLKIGEKNVSFSFEKIPFKNKIIYIGKIKNNS